MKKQFLLAKTLMTLAFTGALTWGTISSVNAQISSYTFAEGAGSYSQITGTTSTATGDDGSENGISIGFTFNFGGTDYTTFSVNTNGFIRLGANIAATPWTNSVANATAQSPLIAAFWDDNNLNTGSIRYATTGSAPNRVLTVDWNQFKIGGGGSTGGASNNMQIRLYESTNVIEYVYDATFATTNAVSAYVGLNSGTFLSVTPGNPSTFSTGTQNHGINNTVMQNLGGKMLTFTPPSCVAPGGLTASLVSTTEGNFSWNVANPIPGVGYEYAITTSATPPGSGTATAGTSFNDNGLTANTTYFLHVRSECDPGVFSGWSTTSFVTTAGFTCALPIMINSFPYAGSHTTCGAGNNYGIQCGGNYGGGEDLVFQIDIATPGTYSIAITGTTTWIGWFLKDNGNCAVPSSCLANAVSGSGTTASGSHNFASAGTYYLVVDTWPTPNCGSFNLAINQILPPDCATNFVVTPTPGCDNFQTTISWDAVPTATAYLVSLGTTPGGNEIANNVNNGNFTSVNFLDPSLNTTYYYTITPTNLGANAVGCVEQQFTTGGQGCACTPVYTNGKTAGDLISNVEIPGTTLANNSGTAQVNPAYTYFIGQPNYTANLVQGGSYNVTISVGTWGNQHLRAWIDYNDNGIFEASESIGSTIVASGQDNTGPFAPAIFAVNLANDAPLGTHRLRIRDVWQSVANPAFAAAIDPCISYSFGETEDYDITIVAPVTTQLQSNFCNITGVTMDMPIRAINVNAPQYRFRIVGANNGGAGWNANTFILDRNSRDMKFAFVPGSLWGTTYTVDVAVGDGFGNYGPYGAACTVSLLGTIPTTQLVAANCNSVNVDPTVNLLATSITSATGYRFQVNGAGVAPNTTVEKAMGGGAMRKLKMQEVAGIMAGETYSVEVAIRDANGNWGAYGTACDVTLMGAPDMVINNDIEMIQTRDLTAIEFGVSASHNPFTTEFGLQVLNANDTETINVAIYDMSGKLIERHAINPMDIEVAQFGSNLASGMYMVEVKQGSNQAVVRQVKN